MMAVVMVTTQARAQDTTAMLKEFNKVMSFSVQPYLYYTAITKMEASPIMQPEDTLSMQGEFYKNGTNLYYSNQQEEMFMEDSFFIQVNHDRKSIWISKVDMDTRDKMNVMPLSDKKVQELFRKRYTIRKTIINPETSHLNFETRQYFDSISVVIVNIGLQYSGKNFLPELMELNVNMKQQIPDEQIQMMKDQGTETGEAIQSIGNTNYLVRTQKVTVQFENIDNTKQKAMQMPSWKERLIFNEAAGEFSGKGIYSDYEITKTF
jgi:uncharacterized protein YoaH (UPF0181 family)